MARRRRCGRCGSAPSGCYPLTGAIQSDGDDLHGIVREMLTAQTSERSGRLIDHDDSASMEKKKREGYF